MLIKPGEIRTWLYMSELRDDVTHDDTRDILLKSRINNDKRNVTGFLITDGSKVMQLIEGPKAEMSRLRKVISKDDRHFNVETEVWNLVSERAYPKWSMRAAKPNEFEDLFAEIENAEIESVAANIATMMFDVTFGAN